MDENKVNPTPNEADQNNIDVDAEETIEVAESDEVTEDVVTETETDASDEEPDDVDDESILGISNEGYESELPAEPVAKKKSKGAAVVLTVLIVLLVAAVIAIVAIFVKSNKAVDFDKVAMNINGTDVSAGEFAYIYASINAYAYGQLTEEQLKEYAIDQAASTIGLYSDAVAAGYALTDEESKSIDDAMASLKESAESQSMTADEYVSKTFGKGYTTEYVRVFMEKNVVASRYYEDLMNGIGEKYGTDAVIEDYYNNNKTAYDLANVSYYCLDANEATATEKADKIVKAAKGDSFASAVKNVDAEGKVNKLTGTLTKTGVSASISEEAAEWIFKTDDNGEYVNKAGSVAKFTKNSMIYVIFVNSEPAKNNAYAVTLDYIQVDVSTDNSALTQDVLKLEAKSTVNSILAEFEKTDKSNDSFTQLVAAYDEGDNELVAGDAFEDITPATDIDAAVIEWAFAQERKVGDYAVVEGDGCYYLVFYREKAEKPVWYNNVKNELISTEQTKWQEESMTKYADEAVKYDDVIDATIKTVNAALSENV